MTKSTELMEPMVKRALGMGARAEYLLMDSWFSAPSVIAKLRLHIHIIPTGSMNTKVRNSG